MDAFALLACPLCGLYNPLFVGLSIFVGTVPVAYVLLRPFSRSIRTWGFPRIDYARLGSLVVMLACLVPLWFIGRQENSLTHVAVCIGGLAVCCTYLWLRACWLLDAHRIASRGKELLFPGLLLPAILVLGKTLGSWLMGVVLFAFVWPTMLVVHTIWSAAIAVPVGLVVVNGLNYTFSKQDLIPPSSVGDKAGSPAPIAAEQNDKCELQ